MTDVEFTTDANRCRRQAIEFAGRPEHAFLLRVAQAFDELASETRSTFFFAEGSDRPAPRGSSI